jgi:hypothetical protein
MRVVDQATGADITEKVGAKPGRGDHGERRPRYEQNLTLAEAEQPVIQVDSTY